MALLRLATPRLDLVKLDLAAMEAWIARDAALLEQLTGARFPEPVDAPPLFREDLVRIRDSAEKDASAGPWLFVLRQGREPVGAGGTAPEGAGLFQIGYALWPAHEGHGYATEAVGPICAWTFAERGALSIRATVPIGHLKSERVVERAGFRRVGEDSDPEAGRVSVFRLEARGRPHAAG